MPNRHSPVFLFVVFMLVLLLACSPDISWDDSYSIKNTPYYQDPVLLQQAWRLPVAKYFQNKFEYQLNNAFCGPATVVNTFYSLGVNKFTQDNIFEPSDINYWKARTFGLTLNELSQLFDDNTNHYKVSILRNISLAEFRQQLLQSNNPKVRYIINFNRYPLYGIKVGHHSPIGGYFKDKDLVFVLDVFSPTINLF